MNKLLILAFNEEKQIEKTVEQYTNVFDEIIIVNDKSKDSTEEILSKLSENNKKLSILTNKKNVGAGKSMEKGIRHALKTPFKYLVKIDGDNQFDSMDVIKILEEAKINRIDFIKCDRFWQGGITGKIPKIRYFGNAFASLLIKLLTGNWKINDPLNGLFLFSYQLAENFKLPKIFYRYGYPFYINSFISRLNIDNNFKLRQYRNKITYGKETSKLNPLIVFSKLITFSISFYFSTIKIKLKYSSHQFSGLIDIFSISSLSISLFSLYMTLITRFFNYQGNQGAWFLLFIIFFILFIILIFRSQKILSNINKEDFTYLN